MGTDRIHRAISDDGTEIAGHVYGQGPPLVLVHGAVADGELEWGALVPFLEEQFTCYLMSTRGRGFSGATTDLAPERLVEDVAAFADSIGEPVGVAGTSGGGMNALGAAARSAAISAVAAHEPPVFEVISEETLADFQDTLERMSEAAAAGRPAEAARIFLEPILSREERAAMSADYFEAAGAYMSVDLEELRQDATSERPGPTHPSVLSRITAPVLITYGSRTAMHSWFTDGVRHVADHVADATVRELPGAGHLAPSMQPEALATELSRFFAATHATV